MSFSAVGLVVLATLVKVENGPGTPNTNNLRSIRPAFEAAGFQFVVSSDGDRAEISFRETWK